MLEGVAGGRAKRDPGILLTYTLPANVPGATGIASDLLFMNTLATSVIHDGPLHHGRWSTFINLERRQFSGRTNVSFVVCFDGELILTHQDLCGICRL